MDLGRLVLGSPILYFQGMRIMMFQLSGFYCSSYKQLKRDANWDMTLMTL